MKFEQGQIVKSNLHSEDYPLFVMVTNETSEWDYFSGTVILCVSAGPTEEIAPWDRPGRHRLDWNTKRFDLSTLEELKQHL